MRLLATLLALSMTIGAPAAFAQDNSDPATLAPELEQCIRENAPKVEAAIPNLADGVDYIVGDMCVVPIASERSRQMRNLMHMQQKRLQEQCAEQKASAKPAVTDEDGEDVCASSASMSDDAGGWTLFAPATADSAPPAARALASQPLLDLRLSHSKAGSTH